jgi:hypothetical protein
MSDGLASSRAEVEALCRRLLGAGETAEAVAATVLARPAEDRIGRLAGAVRDCRSAAPAAPGETLHGGPAIEVGDDAPLALAVATEVGAAARALPERQREVLALRELLRLSYADIGPVMGLPPASMPWLIARARLGLRDQLRGSGVLDDAGCVERERALTALAGRQDGETVQAEEAAWLREHLFACSTCTRSHSAMLEASVCYRGWSARR